MRPATRRVRVWDVPTRLFHWLLAALVVFSFTTGKVGDEERHLRPGDEFTLDREVPHAERYGPEGATYWAARRAG